MKPTSFLQAGVILLASSFQVYAGLEWEKTKAEATTTFGDTKTTLEFPFKNAGSTPVRISSVNPLCDCVTAKAVPADPKKSGDPASFAPGEAGKIVAVFDIGVRQGAQEKKIQVVTGGVGEPASELLVSVKIPEVIQLRPTFVHWKDGEKIEAREVAVEIAQGFPLKSARVTSSSGLIRAELKGDHVQNNAVIAPAPDGGPGKYQIVITPKTEGVPPQALANLHADVNVQLEDTAGHKKNYQIHVRVRGNQERPVETQ